MSAGNGKSPFDSHWPAMAGLRLSHSGRRAHRDRHHPALSRRARLDPRVLAAFSSVLPNGNDHPQTRVTTLYTFPSTHGALASHSHAPHAALLQTWIPTVDRPLAAHGQRASWTAESPCAVLFRPCPGHDTGGSPWVRGLYGANGYVESE